jgi:hypothetical protein
MGSLSIDNSVTNISRLGTFNGTVKRDGFCQNWGSFEISSLKSEARRFLEKSAPPPCCESPLKITATPRTAVGYLETNCQCANENSSHRRMDTRHFCLSAFSMAELSFPILCVSPPAGLNIATGIITIFQYCGGFHCAVANITKGFTAPLPISWRS